MSLHDNVRDRLPQWSVPHWSSYPALLGAGVVCYLGLVAGMIYAIVTQIHVEEWPAPAVHSTSPVVLTIPVLDLVAEPCIHDPDGSARLCDAKSRFDAARAKLTHRYAQRVHAGRNGTGNLLWAPPGAVLLVTEDAAATSGAAPAVEARAGNLEWSAGNSSNNTTVASR
jgi:hypothetical protein